MGSGDHPALPRHRQRQPQLSGEDGNVLDLTDAMGHSFLSHDQRARLASRGLCVPGAARRLSGAPHRQLHRARGHVLRCRQHDRPGVCDHAREPVALARGGHLPSEWHPLRLSAAPPRPHLPGQDLHRRRRRMDRHRSCYGHEQQCPQQGQRPGRGAAAARACGGSIHVRERPERRVQAATRCMSAECASSRCNMLISQIKTYQQQQRPPAPALSPRALVSCALSSALT
mmetsp:Transcript_2658/g.5757  ORF Transcript_2658/g.5757 Transcript_2658/m.5757 type:complete len:229 (+) Transcript_2658:455-1141(+)